MPRAAAKIVIKSAREIELMRSAGGLVFQVLEALDQMAEPGVTTAAMDRRAEELIREAGATPLFKGVENPQARFPFPACICASVNEQVVHGIPSDVPLKDGDIVSVDCGVKLKGYCGDSARTLAIGTVAGPTRRLMDVTREALEIAIREIRPGRHWSEVAALMQACVEDAGFGVVREFVGHGIGQRMHEEPKVPNYVDRNLRNADFELVPGMVLAIEPMVTAGHPGVQPGDETGWPIVTRDGSCAAHYEHSVAVVKDGADVLSDGRLERRG
jgi:methionyl aminopeptidase